MHMCGRLRTGRLRDLVMRKVAWPRSHFYSWPETIVIKSVVRPQGWQRADANAISKEDLSCSINPCSSIFQLWEVNLKIWMTKCSEFCHWETNCPWVMNFSHSRRLSSLNIDWIFSDHCSDFFTCHGAKAKPPSVRRKHEKTQIIMNTIYECTKISLKNLQKLGWNNDRLTYFMWYF